MAAARIIVVEDEAVVAANLQARLQSVGYDVLAVIESGERAVALVGELHPDLVLMDIRLAGKLDGIAAAAQIAERFDVPVIYLTAYTDEETVRRARLTAPYGYVLKPFDVREVLTSIEMALFRHQSERRIRERERWFETTLRSIADAVISTDTKGRVTFLNRVAESITGWSAAEAIGRPISEVMQLLGEDPRLVVENPALVALRTRGSVELTHHVLLRGRDGRETWVDDSAAPIRDDAGQISGAVLVFRDITERRRADEALRASEDRRRLIELAVQHVAEMVMITDATLDPPGPRILFVNQSFTRQTGYSAEEVLGKTPRLLQGPKTDRTALDGVRAALAAGQPYRTEAINYRKDGSEFIIEWNLIPLRDEHHAITSWVATLHDVTQRRREQETRWQRQKLESLGVLAGGVAHDFNNILTVILGTASLAAIEAPPDSPVHAALATIEGAARRAAELTRQMLAYAGKGRFLVELVDLNALVIAAAAPPQLTLPARVTLRYDLAPKLPLLVADATQLRRAIYNLVLNAVEACGDLPGTVTISTLLRFVSRQELELTHLGLDLPAGDYAIIRIQDTGGGMDRATLERAFEPFFTTKFAGRGLGLAEVLGIVGGHRGAMRAESTRGGGTTMTVLLPAQSVQEARVHLPAQRLPGIAQTSPSAALVLVVDDEDGVREVAARILQLAGYRVITAEHGLAALQVYGTNPGAITCVLLDLTMPQMDGERVLRELSEFDPDARVILMSGYDEQDVAARFQNASLVGFLQKPFKPEALLELVRRASTRSVAHQSD
jgi:PAS domain S-box-containing protein